MNQTFLYTTHQDYWSGELDNLDTPAKSRYRDNATLCNATDGVAATLETFVDRYANFVGQIALTQNQIGLRIGSLSAQITRANAVLALMGYSLTPDVTTGSLSINDAASANPGFRLTTFGGGFTWSREFPLFLEGTAAYSRYDPTFIATNGQESRPIPVKWDTLTGTGGIGWDFFLTEELRLRPIFNFSLGRVSSDLSIASAVVENITGTEVDFVKNGKLNALGLGGALMLDYEPRST